jgi:hypothetical protein
MVMLTCKFLFYDKLMRISKLMHSKTDALQADALQLQILYHIGGEKDGSGVIEKTYVRLCPYIAF